MTVNQDAAHPGEEAPSLFPRVADNEFGYDPAQVERFLQAARATYEGQQADDAVTSSVVRRTTFDPVRGGFEPREVDGALDRLEDVFAARERNAMVQEQGQERWIEGIAQVSGVLRARLHREPGERFRRPSRKNVPSYAIEDVDAMCDRLIDYFERDVPLSVDDVRRAVFGRAMGDEGYEENQVDAFLDRTIELMASID
ncbi:DivIVA domain-containing protein [Galactobacter caseinivorans]|uniref:DivIVA domain-containing protein n=1 Tax=Galactobacter caseinivorans TaxID=2676123 RepID=UPI0018F55310|nr:DivIVA domain-containing protein [Galactobacter caseinivorans]